jgi:DNA-binding transcriptional regulator YhcF (GntR family)
MLPFRIQFVHGVPVSEQLVLAVRRAVLSGELRDGDEFPSVRTMAQELKISPATIHKVVAELRDAGFLASRPGIGMVVTVPRGEARAAMLDHLTPACETLLREAAMLRLPLDDVIEALRRTAKARGFRDPK